MKKRILVAMPALNSVEPKTVRSLVNMIGFTIVKTNYAVQFETFGSSILSGVRNFFVESALQGGYDYLLMIDADMDFPPYTLAKMLMAEKDIVCANCVTKSEDSSVFTSIGFDKKRVVTDYDKEGIEEVVLSGTGIMLIDMKIIKDIPRPWFLQPWDYVNDRITGEDYYFCNKATDLGFKVFIDHDVSRQVFHIGKKSFNINDALISKMKHDGLLSKDSTESNNSPPEGGVGGL